MYIDLQTNWNKIEKCWLKRITMKKLMMKWNFWKPRKICCMKKPLCKKERWNQLLWQRNGKKCLNNHEKRWKITVDKKQLLITKQKWPSTTKKHRQNGICTFSELSNEKEIDCLKLLNTERRREILKKSNCIFNCLKPRHSTAECWSTKCTKCNRRYHTSNCTFLPTTTINARKIVQNK